MSKRKNLGISFSGKGYYIALALCAAAIGISGYLYYRNANTADPQLNAPSDAVLQNGDLAVVAPQPNSGKPAVDPAPTEKPAPKPLKTAMPLEGKTVADYAMDCLSYNETTRDWRVHNGIDIAAEAGTKVTAAADGTVYTVYEDDSMGTTVVIRHQDGYVTKYASLDKEVSVSAGDTVKLGQPIGTVGNTALLETAMGNHLHFSVTHKDAPMNPLNFINLK